MKKHKKLSIVFISTGIFFVIVALTLTTLFIITKRTYAGNSYITQEEISQMPDNSILAKIENYEESGNINALEFNDTNVAHLDSRKDSYIINVAIKQSNKNLMLESEDESSVKDEIDSDITPPTDSIINDDSAGADQNVDAEEGKDLITEPPLNEESIESQEDSLAYIPKESLIALGSEVSSNNRVLKITLKPGINFIKQEEDVTLNNMLESVDYSDNSKNILGTDYSANDGTKTYIFKDTANFETNPIVSFSIEPDKVLDFTDEIKDAIIIEFYNKGQLLDTKKISVKNNFSNNEDHKIEINGNDEEKVLAFSDTDSYSQYGRIAGVYSNERVILYKSIKVKLEVTVPLKEGKPYQMPKYIGTLEEAIQTDPENISTLDINSSNSFIKESGPSNCKANDSTTETCEYIFKAENIYAVSYGLNVKWQFPDDYFSEGDHISVKATKVIYQTYGSQTAIENDCNYEHNFLVDIPHYLAGTGVTDYVIENGYNSSFPKDEIALGYFGVANNSPKATKREQDLIYHFDDNINVTGIFLPSVKDYEDILTEVWVKTKKNNNWKKYNVNIKSTEYTKKSSRYYYPLTIDDLGLRAKDDYITDLFYNIGIIPGNFNRIKGSSLEQCFYGFVNDSVKNYSTTFTIDDHGYMESCIKGSCDESLFHDEDYLKSTYILGEGGGSTYFMGTRISSQNLSSLQTAHFGFGMGATLFYAGHASMHLHHPIIYIRSEVGTDPTNIRLISIVNDKYGQEINKEEIPRDEYIVDCYDSKSEEGVRICKIDTSGMKNNNPLINTTFVFGTKLIQISFDINVATNYHDGDNVYHYYKDMVFFTDSDIKRVFGADAPVSSYKQGDPFDVNNDGRTDDELITYRNTTNSDFYRFTNTDTLEAELTEKSSKEKNYYKWLDSTYDVLVGNEKGIDAEISISNDLNIQASTTVYFPIPKAGENWQELSNNTAFTFSLKLRNKIENLDKNKYTISYGINETYNNFSNNTINWINEDNINKDQLKNVNIIKIEAKNIPAKTREQIHVYMDLVDEGIVNQRLQLKFKYTAIKSNNNEDSYSNYIGVNINNRGNVVTHYYLNNTTDELSPSEKTSGYVGEGYITNPKDIEGYVLDYKQIPTNAKGNYEEGTIEVNYYYKLKPVISLNPFTGDNVFMSFAILGVAILILILSILFLIKRTKKSKIN